MLDGQEHLLSVLVGVQLTCCLGVYLTAAAAYDSAVVHDK